MRYGHMPLYPPIGPGCGRDACVRVPIFDNAPGGAALPACEQRRVALENPCCPGQWAEVLLGVDECGNLTVCVHRLPCGRRPHCPPPRGAVWENPRWQGG